MGGTLLPISTINHKTISVCILPRDKSLFLSLFLYWLTIMLSLLLHFTTCAKETRHRLTNQTKKKIDFPSTSESSTSSRAEQGNISWMVRPLKNVYISNESYKILWYQKFLYLLNESGRQTERQTDRKRTKSSKARGEEISSIAKQN